MYRLKIDGNDIDITNDIALKFTYSNIDVSDPAAVKNSFSKTVKIPGTPKNNNVFGNIWNTTRNVNNTAYKKSGAGFNPKKKVEFVLTDNGNLVERGYVKLNKVTSNFYFQEYELTLYGDLGDFFYSLSTKEDGKKKTLADLYYGFSPALAIGDSKEVMTSFNEDSDILMKWTSDIICEGWHELSYMRESSATTKVNNFITAVPCLTGLYDDFDSKSMLVNNLIRYQLLPSECINKWDEALPTSFTTDEQAYTLYQDPLSAYKSCYSKIEYPRNIEGIEAGDLRATELPVAIKLSKVLEAIAATGNNGGYEVEYSTAFTTSHYWKNGWIMLDKPDFTLIPDRPELNVGNFYVDAYTQLNNNNNVIANQNIVDGLATWSLGTCDLTGLSNPELNIVFNNKVTVIDTMSTGETVDLSYISEISNNYAWGKHVMVGGGQGGYHSEWEQLGWIWHALVCIIYLYDGNSIVDTKGVLFHIDNKGMRFGGDIPESTWKPAILSRVNSYFGTTLNDLSIHQCITTVYTNGNVEYAEPVIETIPITFSSSNFKVGFRLVPVAYYKGAANDQTPDVEQAYLPYIDPLINWTSGQTTAAQYQRCPYHFLRPQTGWHSSGWGGFNYTNWMHHRTNLALNYNNWNNGVVVAQEYYTTVNATKKVLLSNSMSPYELLTNIAKMLNMRFLYDKANKKVSVLPTQEYYFNTYLKIDDDIDLNKNLSHNFILSESKYIDFSYEKNDAYPVYLWRKNNDKEYESFNFDTGLEFNFDTKKLFDNKFKQSSLYQINSQFLKTFDGMVLPSVFGTNVFDYSLFHQGQNQVIDSESVQKQTGCSNPNTKVKSDPWLCLFDKSQKRLNTQMPSLLFLNGFYKNYRQISYKEDNQQTSNPYINVPKIMVSDDFYVEDYLNSDRCWLWSYDLQYGNFTGWGYTFEHNACVWAMPFFSRDLTIRTSGAEWINSKRTLASWDMVYDYTEYYTENDMTLIKYPTTFTLYATGNIVQSSAVTVIEDVKKNLSVDNYIYPRFWQKSMEEIYDDDCREIEVYVDLKCEDPNTALRKFYRFLGCNWILEKIIDMERKDIHNGFTKCKFVKINNPMNVMNYSLEQIAIMNAEAEKEIEAQRENE